MAKLKLFVSNNMGTWGCALSKADMDGGFTHGSICDEGVQEYLGLDTDSEYKLTILDKKPKNWRTSLTLSYEPTVNGNALFLKKRGKIERLDDKLAKLIFDVFYFNNGPIKVWIKLKRIDD